MHLCIYTFIHICMLMHVNIFIIYKVCCAYIYIYIINIHKKMFILDAINCLTALIKYEIVYISNILLLLNYIIIKSRNLLLL